MTAGRLGERALTVVLALVVCSLVLGHVLGQPILLGYVATGSMSPTLEAGDGFVAVPSALTDSPEPGDVVVFEARELHGGGLTTHRVVGVTEAGYVTRGDANPFTDQDGVEPPVSDGQIVAEALQVRGHVVTIPHLGTAVMGVRSAVGSVVGAFGTAGELSGEDLGAALVAVGIAILGFGLLLDATGAARRDVSRATTRENVLAFWAAVGFVLLVLVILATAAMVFPSGVYDYGVVATDEPTDDPQVVAPGETAQVTRTVENAGYLPVVVVVEPAGPGVATDPERLTVGARASGETTVSLEAPAVRGKAVRQVGEYRYPLVLPPVVLAGLHDVHPLAAIAAVDAIVVGGAVAIVFVLFGYDDFRIRRPGHHVPLRTRLGRKLRKWFR